MYKKIALATIVIAPLLAEFASRLSHGSAPAPVAQAVVANATEIPAPRAATGPDPIHYSAIPQPSNVASGPLDPTPTLDPDALATTPVSADGAPPAAMAEAPAPPASDEVPPTRPHDSPERY